MIRDLLLGSIWVLLMLYFASGAWSALRRATPSEAELASALETLPGDSDCLYGWLDPPPSEAPREPNPPASATESAINFQPLRLQ